MLYNNFKLGDRVDILSKSTGCPIRNSVIYDKYKEGASVYVVDIRYNCLVVSNSDGGDYYLPSDLRHVNPPFALEIDKMFDDLLHNI